MPKTRPRFTSTAAPTEADIALWESLTPEEQRAELDADLAEAMAEAEREGTVPAAAFMEQLRVKFFGGR